MAGASDAAGRTAVVLVADESLCRDLLRIVLTDSEQIQVLGTFADGETALQHVPPLEPQVAILDIHLAGAMNGITLGLKPRQRLPHMGVVLLANESDPDLLASLPPEAAGGWSYFLKKSVGDAQGLVPALRGAVRVRDWSCGV